jgi:hypothetical protein
MNQTTRCVSILAVCLLAAPPRGAAQQSGNTIPSDWTRIAARRRPRIEAV